MRRKDTHKGTDNVLIDLGFDDAEELSAKAVLAVKLNELIRSGGLSQTEAAAITGMTQPKVSQVARYKHRCWRCRRQLAPDQITASSPLRSSRLSSFNEGPLGCLSPTSHLRTVERLVFNTAASTAWLTCR